MITLSEHPRILIILMGSIGDVVRALPLAHALKQSYPESFLGWLVEPKSFELVSKNKFIDKVFLFNRNQGVGALFGVLKEVRKESFEITLDLQRHFKSGVSSFFSGSQYRLGFHRRNSKELNWIFNNDQVNFRSETESKLEHYLDFLRHLNIPLPAIPEFGLKPDLSISTKSIKRVQNLKGPLIGFILGSTWKSKDWLPQGYLNLAEILLARTAGTVILLGDKSKEDLSRSLESRLSSPQVVNLCGETSLRELIYILSKLSVCVGPDSGPGHIAAALKVPYISLFGATLPARVAPYGMENMAIRSAIGCSPCLRKICPGLNTLCMRLISAESVSTKIIEILSTKDS